jgi:molybdopterin synthase sulfur carrier subunit
MTNNNTITIKFFALVREQVGVDELIEDHIANESMEELVERLAIKNAGFRVASSSSLVMACNQTIVEASHLIEKGDEIAFFPPVTGG